MSKLCIIGSSEIVTQHLIAAKAVGFKLHSITSLNKNSKNIFKLKKKFKIKKTYNNWRECIKESAKIKDMCFLISPRIQDTIKVLNKTLKYNKPILVEKPIANDDKKLNNDILKSKNIFVGYNRIFYKTVNYLKENLSSGSLISVICSEKNVNTFINNSCHIISILTYCFGDLKILNKYKKKNYILCNLKDKKKSLINLKIVFESPVNFSIKVLKKNKVIILSPIEQLSEFNKLKLIKNKNFNFYKPILKNKINDYESNIKPGFLQQYKNFLKFSKNKNKNIINNIIFAKNVLRLSKKIVS